MANSTRKCKHCSEYKSAESGVKTPVAWFCCHVCAIDFAREKAAKVRERKARSESRQRKQAQSADKVRLTQKRKELNRPHHLDQLQKLVNQYVVHVRDKDKPCCTCGTSNPSIKYDAGHLRTRGACPELRFELTNIHKQCSVNCNQHKSGAVAEHKEYVIKEHGQDALDWLYGPHQSLKEQLPDVDSIDAEIARYRKIIRDAGLTPRA